MWKDILQASKITEATQFIVSYAKIMEQIYFRLAVLYYSVIRSNIVLQKTGKCRIHTKFIKYFSHLGPFVQN